MAREIKEEEEEVGEDRATTVAETNLATMEGVEAVEEAEAASSVD